MRLLALVVIGVALPVAGAASAVTSGAPTAITGPVSQVSASAATANGTVNPNGHKTSYYFEYGTSASYGSKTAPTGAGADTANVSVAALLPGLSPATTYHYRLVATNRAGTSKGSDGLFATLSGPAAVTGNASQVAPFKAVLNGSVDPNGRATSYYFEYGPTTAYGSKTQARSAGAGTSPVGVAIEATGLAAGKTYHFRLVASSDAGTSRGDDRSFTTNAPPSAWTGSASSIGLVSATLNGRVNPRGRATTAYFDYGTTTSYGARSAVVNAGSGNSSKWIAIPVGGLSPGVTYHFRMVAASDAGTIVGSDRAFTTKGGPTVVTGAASSVAPTSAVVSGTVNPNARSTSWWFEYGTSTSYGTSTARISAGSGTATQTVAMTLSGLQPGAVYHYRLVAQNSAATVAGADASFATPGPPSVTTGAPFGIGTSSASVSGTLNPNGRETTWFFEFGLTAGYGMRTNGIGAGAGTANVNVSSGLGALAPGRRYHYRLVAISDAGTTVGHDASFATSSLPRSPSGAIVHCTVTGTQGNDTLHGTGGGDVICGLGGSDTILGGGGADVIYAGPGDDVVRAGAGNDTVYGSFGRDTLFGELGTDKLVGGDGANVLYGGRGADTLIGAGVGDVLIGGLGRDRMFGQGGNDMIYARDGARDMVDGGSGRDAATFDRLDVRSSVERRR
jgi:hemolysin type calcium-binding protein